MFTTVMPNQTQKVQNQQKNQEVTKSAWFNLQNPAKVRRYSRIYAGNKDPQDMTALMHAAVKYESKTHTQNNKTALMFAVENNNIEATDALLCQTGIRTKCSSSQYQANTTALTIAMQNQNLILFNKLLPYERDSASLCQMHIDAFTFTIHHDINKFFNTHFTPDLLLRNPLHYAVLIKENSDIYRQFIASLIVNQDMKLYSPFDIYGLAPIHYAVLYNNLPAVQQLVRQQGQLATNKQYRIFKNGSTPIMIASMLEEWDIVQFLQQYTDSIVQQQKQTQKIRNSQYNEINVSQLQQQSIEQNIQQSQELNQALERSSVYYSTTYPNKQSSPQRMITIQAPEQSQVENNKLLQSQRELAVSAIENELNNAKLTGQVQQLTQKIESQTQMINVMEISLQNARQDKEDQRAMNKQLQEQIDEMKQYKQQVTQLQQQLEEQQTKQQELQQELFKYQNKEDQEQSLQNLINELSQHKQQLIQEKNDLQNQNDIINDELQQNKVNINQLIQQKDQQESYYKQQIAQLQNEMTQQQLQYEQEINNLNTSITNQQTKFETKIQQIITEGQNQVQTLQQTITEKETQLENFEEDKQQYQNQIQELSKQAIQKDDQIKKDQKQWSNEQQELSNAYKQLETKLQQQSEQIEQYKQNITQLQQTINQYKQSIDTLQTEIENKNNQQQQLYSQKDNQIQLLMKQIQDLTQQNNQQQQLFDQKLKEEKQKIHDDYQILLDECADKQKELCFKYEQQIQELQEQQENVDNDQNSDQIQDLKDKIIELENQLDEKDTEIENYKFEVQDSQINSEQKQQINQLQLENQILQKAKDSLEQQLDQELEFKKKLLDELALQHQKFRDVQRLVKQSQQNNN